MSKEHSIHTCYGCPAYYSDGDGTGLNKWPRKHCNYDHLQCPFYWGEGDPLIVTKKKGD